jgi:ABC-2 type transport system permease protein
MRTWVFLKKTFLENLREWKILIVTLALAPGFVYLMQAYFAAAAPSYRLLVLQRDQAEGGDASGAAGLIAAWRALRHPDGQPAFVVTRVTDLASALDAVRRREAELVVEIPEGFTRRLQDYRAGKAETPARLVNHGDPSNVRSSMAMAYSDYLAHLWVASATGASFPLELAFEGVGAGRPLSDFDLYVPALLVLAVIMVMFTAAATLIREIDKGTMTRLVLSPLRTHELLAAVSLNQLLIGLVSLALTFLAALSVGYRPQGSLLSVLAVGAVATLGVVALSIGVAAFLNSIFELLTVGCFPFFILMFFSESMFPLPKLTMFHLAVRALSRILNFGAGLDEVAFELTAALLLTAFYYLLGAWLFARRHLRIR